MCLLACLFRMIDEAPLIVAANREEYYQRGGDPPALLEGPVRCAAGVDPTAGGTWLGVNEYGLLVALTNRGKSEPPARPRSRGLLVRDLLACRTAEQALARATRELERGDYAGCNVVCADTGHAVVVQAGDWLRVRYLPPGVHVLTNGDVNDGSDVRVAHALDWLQQRPYREVDSCVWALRQLCAQHEPDYPPICFRLAERGTVSSSLLALRPALAESLYLHAQGQPDRTPYADYSHLLRQLAGPRTHEVQA
jgi:uncharacterized protein with NRDE domain